MDNLVQVGNLLIGGGVLAALAGTYQTFMTYKRGINSDAIEAYSDLYTKVKKEVHELERKLEKRDQKILEMSKHISRLEEEVAKWRGGP